jgi:hypothetical protein
MDLGLASERERKLETYIATLNVPSSLPETNVSHPSGPEPHHRPREVYGSYRGGRSENTNLILCCVSPVTLLTCLCIFMVTLQFLK